MLRPGELDDEEIAAWLDAHRDELAELGPGRHELAPIETVASPVALQRADRAAAPRHRTRTRLVQALVVLALFAGLFFLDTRARALAASLRTGARRDGRQCSTGRRPGSPGTRPR